MSLPAWKPSPRRGTVLVVLILHGLLLGGASRLGVWPERGTRPVAPRLDVRLIWQRFVAPEPAPVAPPSRTLDTVPTRPQPPRRAPAAPATAGPVPKDPALRAITLSPSAPAASAPAPTGDGSASPLNLALPRGASAPWRQRPQALDDLRSNTPKLTMEQKLAMAMGGDGDWVEESIDADHRRLRRGNVCVYLQRPAAAQLDPFHAANRNLPWQVGRPTRCD